MDFIEKVEKYLNKKGMDAAQAYVMFKYMSELYYEQYKTDRELELPSMEDTQEQQEEATELPNEDDDEEDFDELDEPVQMKTAEELVRENNIKKRVKPKKNDLPDLDTVDFD